MQKNKDIVIANENGSSLPVVLGNCPSCGSGHRSLILTDFIQNAYNPERSSVFFTCLKCFNVIKRRVCDVAEED